MVLGKGFIFVGMCLLALPAIIMNIMLLIKEPLQFVLLWSCYFGALWLIERNAND